MSVFAFLQREWPSVYEAAAAAESAAYPDPRTVCFHARGALELAVAWIYKHDPSLKLPYQDNLSALIHEPTFKTTAGEAVFSKARVITRLGNQAVHSHKPIPSTDAVVAVRELFHVAYWLALTYGRLTGLGPSLTFNADSLPRTAPLPKQTVEQLQVLEEQLREKDESLAALLADKGTLDEELKRLRAEVAEAKKAASAQPDTHDYGEAETRDYFTDLLLKETGGRSTSRETASSRSPACPITTAAALWTTCSWAMTGSRWPWLRPEAQAPGFSCVQGKRVWPCSLLRSFVQRCRETDPLWRNRDLTSRAAG